jgi:hypothetical protein
MARDWRLCISINWNVDIPISTFQFQNIGFKISRHLTYECKELKMLAYQQFIELSIFITAKPV